MKLDISASCTLSLEEVEEILRAEVERRNPGWKADEAVWTDEMVAGEADAVGIRTVEKVTSVCFALSHVPVKTVYRGKPVSPLLKGDEPDAGSEPPVFPPPPMTLQELERGLPGTQTAQAPPAYIIEAFNSRVWKDQATGLYHALTRTADGEEIAAEQSFQNAESAARWCIASEATMNGKIFDASEFRKVAV